MNIPKRRRLTRRQQRQIERQLEAHRHSRYTTDFVLDEDHVLKGFTVFPNVLRPELTMARYTARFLFFNNGLYRNRTCIDMGCGSGILGVVMALQGAKRVVFSDVSTYAVRNTERNVRHFRLASKSVVHHGDLFETIRERADVIVFNHPFFPAEPIRDIPVSIAMLDDGKLIHRFLKQAKSHLKPGGKIFMPFWDFVGETNHPAIQGWKHSYSVRRPFSTDSTAGLQQGEMSIFELTLPSKTK